MLRLSFLFFLVVVFTLPACGNQTESSQATVPPPTATVSAATATTPPTEQAKIDTPTAAPTNTVVAAEVVATETAVPAPTDTPAPAPTEAPVQGNPDLNFAQVVFVSATQNSSGLWQFNTTVRHNDEGWDHYADAWQVVDLEGNVLAERILAHPHDTEQPFTRSQSGIDIPPEMTQVMVRAKCNIHGFGGQEILVDLTANSGENFEVSRP